jgi:hypothetical protein
MYSDESEHQFGLVPRPSTVAPYKILVLIQLRKPLELKLAHKKPLKSLVFSYILEITGQSSQTDLFLNNLVYCTFLLKQSLVCLAHYEVILYKFWPLFDNLAIFKAANFPSRFSNFKKLVLSYAWPKNRPPGHSAPFSSAVAAIHWFIPDGGIIDMEH